MLADGQGSFLPRTILHQSLKYKKNSSVVLDVSATHLQGIQQSFGTLCEVRCVGLVRPNTH